MSELAWFGIIMLIVGPATAYSLTRLLIRWDRLRDEAGDDD